MFTIRHASILLLLTNNFAAATTDPPPLGKLVDVGGYRVHLYCMGTGSPAVVVAGGAFSFDWGLIQPDVAKFRRICTYDPPGTAWSDPYLPAQQQSPRCIDRVAELHWLLIEAAVPGPYVLVGFSIGGLVGRLYTHEYPREVAGMVIVDHAFIDVGSDAAHHAPVSAQPSEPKASLGSTLTDSVDSPPVLISSSPITLGLENDWNFNKLPQRNRDLHLWAMSIHPARPTPETAAECSATVENATKDQAFPFGDKPLIVIRTAEDLPAYERLQTKLLRLSRNSKQIVAENSSHMIIIDEPELVTNSIREVVEAVRNGSKLK
jgi:pimeloyl-ACP methyl ester carboxylesterase